MKYISGNIINHFLSINEIKIFYNTYNLYVTFNNFIKISDEKYSLVNTNDDKSLLSVIIIKIANENVKIRYFQFFCHQLFYYSFKNQLSATAYNGLIAIGSSYVLGLNNNIDYASLIILSYPNSTDFDVDISSYLEGNKK